MSVTWGSQHTEMCAVGLEPGLKEPGVTSPSLPSWVCSLPQHPPVQTARALPRHFLNCTQSCRPLGLALL